MRSCPPVRPPPPKEGPRTTPVGHVARTFRVLVAATGCSVLAGCFTLTPIRLDTDIQPGRSRIHLTESGVTRVADVLGERVTVLNGEVTRSTPNEIVVLVPSSGPAAFGEKALYQELRLPKDDVTSIERRQLNKLRTGLTVGGVTAAVGFVLYKAISGKTGSTPDGGGGGPSESLVPIFRIFMR